MRPPFQYTAIVVATTCLVPISVHGQELERSGIIEEITVTTERREQSLQDVPLSVTAFSGDTRDRMGIISIQDMSDFTPGFSFNMASDRPSIRGIGRQSNSFSLDSPVANYIDGIYTSSIQDAQYAPMFVERTEILRGPQGALSGRGSIAGAVSTYLKRPSHEFEIETRAFAKNFRGYGGGLTISGPVTDKIRLRLNLSDSEQDDGFFKNVANGNTEGNQPYRRQAADYMMEMDVTDNLQWFVKASMSSYDESRRTGGARAPYTVSDIEGLTPIPYGYLGSPLLPNAAYGYFSGTYTGPSENPGIDDYREFSSNFNSSQKLDDHHNYVSHLTWDTDAVQVKWIAGHQNYYYEQLTDGDGTGVTSMNLYSGRVVDPSSINQYDEQREWLTNELTVASNSDGAFTWLTGLYHSKEEYVQHPLITYNPGYNELAAPVAGLGNPYATAANTHGNASVFGEVEGETNSYAVFGQLEYQYSDELKFTLGLRQNWDKKDLVGQTRYIGNNFASPAIPAPLRLVDFGVAIDATTPIDPTAALPRGVTADYFDPVTGRRVREMEGDWDALAGTIGVDYAPNTDTLLYFRVATGYRSGGFDAPYLRNDPIVDEETVLSYELGYKGKITDRLQLNASTFLYDFKDQQLPLPALGRCTDVADLSTCTVITDFKNIPKTQNWGIELEGTWYATDKLNFFLSYGYLNTEIKDGGEGYQNPLDPAAIASNADRMAELTGQLDAGYTNLPRWIQDISGNSLANSPKHKIALNTSYHMNFEPGNLLLSANYVWRDDSEDDVFNTPQAVIDGYGTLSARAIWTGAEDNYSVIFFVSNLTDVEARDGGGTVRRATSASGAAGQTYYESYNLNPPRTYGVEFQYRFRN